MAKTAEELKNDLFKVNLKEMVTAAGSVAALTEQAQKIADDEKVVEVGAATGTIFSVAVSDWGALTNFIATNDVPQNRPFLRSIMASIKDAVVAEETVKLATLLLTLMCFHAEKRGGGL